MFYKPFLLLLTLLQRILAENSLDGFAFSCGVRANFVQTGPFYAFGSDNKIYCATTSIYECGSYSYDKNSKYLSTIINDSINFNGNQVLTKNHMIYEGILLSFEFDLGFQVNPCIVQSLDWRQIENTRTEVFFTCPTMNWIPNTSYERIEFSLYNTGYFWHTVWLEITYGSTDTIRSDYHGVYAYNPSNGRIHLYSGVQAGKEARVLRGTLTSDGALVIDGYTQVDNKPCQAQSVIDTIPSAKTYPIPLTIGNVGTPLSSSNRTIVSKVMSLFVVTLAWYFVH
jgi:hypothetical protein